VGVGPASYVPGVAPTARSQCGRQTTLQRHGRTGVAAQKLRSNLCDKTVSTRSRSARRRTKEKIETCSTCFLCWACLSAARFPFLHGSDPITSDAARERWNDTLPSHGTQEQSRWSRGRHVAATDNVSQQRVAKKKNLKISASVQESGARLRIPSDSQTRP